MCVFVAVLAQPRQWGSRPGLAAPVPKPAPLSPPIARYPDALAPKHRSRAPPSAFPAPAGPSNIVHRARRERVIRLDFLSAIRRSAGAAGGAGQAVAGLGAGHRPSDA